MTSVAVLADPPRSGLVLTELTESGPLSPDEAVQLSGAMVRDVCRAVEKSGGELIVNYRSDEDLPDENASGEDAEAELRSLIEPALDDPEAARFEPQVGSTRAARVGNTVTHLLEEEDVATAAVVDPATPLLGRDVIDSAAMKLRRSDVVLGPATAGRVYYAGFGEPVDFTDALEPPAVETLTRRARDADLDVDFLPMRSTVETTDDLSTALPELAARGRAGRLFVEHTSACLSELGLVARNTADGLAVVRE